MLNHVEVEVQFGLGTGLAFVEAQVLLGVAEGGKLDLEAGAVESEEACRRQVWVRAIQQHPSFVCGSAPRGRTYATCSQCYQALLCSSAWYRSIFSFFRVVRGHARQVAAVQATVELPLAARSPRVGPGVAQAQDLVFAKPFHHVQAQHPHPAHYPQEIVTVALMQRR